MKSKLISLLIIFASINVHAQIDYSFTYQGQLTDNGSPAQGTFDIKIQAFDNANATGGILSESIHTNTTVNAGVFTLQQVDLGSMIFDGMVVWLQILVKKTADVGYTILLPLQKMGSVPYANSLIDKGATDGQVLTFDAVNGWQPVTPAIETDNQNIENLDLVSTILTVGIENGSSQDVDLAVLQDGTGTDDQNISGSRLSGTILIIGIEGGTNQAIDLAPLQIDSASKIDDLTDAKSDSDGSNNGSSLFIGVNSGAADDGSDNKNVSMGFHSLSFNTEGSSNTANGYSALKFNTSGQRNTAIGAYSLLANDTGIDNTANGHNSLRLNTIGIGNTATGYNSLYSNKEGIVNTANGKNSLFSNSTGSSNTASGVSSLYSNTEGTNNTASGVNSLFSNTTGNFNTAIGNSAFSDGTDYFNSTAIGNNAEPGASNTVRIGNALVSAIGGYANWTNVSDARFKTNIKEDVPGLAFIKKLRPVTYQLNMDAIAKFNKTSDESRVLQSEALKAAEIQTGFLAQEVEAAALSLGYDFHGVDKPKNESSHYGLRYAEFVVPLVKAVQELSNSNNTSFAKVQIFEVTSQQLQKQIEHLKADNQQLKSRLENIEQLLLKQIK